MSRMALRSQRWGQFSCTPGERVTTCSCIKVGPSSVVAMGPSAVCTVVISISRCEESSRGARPRRAPLVSAQAGEPRASTGVTSAAGSGGRALDQLLGARLDPRKEARHHDAHAQARVALDVADVDQGAGHAAGLDDLLDGAVDGLLDLGMPYVADLAHRGGQ